MAPSLKLNSCGIDSNQWQLIRSYLLNRPAQSEDEGDCFIPENDRSKDDENQWEDLETESENGDDVENDEHRRPARATKRSLQTSAFWLQNLHIATIPTFELYVFARGNRILALELAGSKGQWRVLFQKELSDSNVTAVVCLPIPPVRVTDPRPYEWTAILIGMENGHVTAFNERGDELLAHKFYTKPVTEMRLQADQLFVTYHDYLVAVSGFTLLASLKANRQLTLRHRVPSPYLSDHKRGDSSSPSFPADQLVYEYWQLENVGQPTSVVATGAHRTSVWEKMVTASIKGGFNASISHRQPSYETFCSTNSKNFVSFNWWTDDTPPNLLAGITSKLKSSVSVSSMFASSWWSGPAKPSSSSSSTVSDKSSTSAGSITSRDVPQRSSLPDGGRVGEKVILALGDRLAAVCDDLGRVSLVDVQRRLLLRMWKGYRDAQCAWIELAYEDENEQKSPSVSSERKRCNVLCLVIFAPRRGILEVWSTQNGRRLAAFNVDRRGALIYCPATTLSKSGPVDYSQTTRFLDSNGQFFHVDLSAAVVMEPHEMSTYWTTSAKEDFRRRWNGSLSDESSLNLASEILGRLLWIKDIDYLIDKMIGSSKIDYRFFIRFIDAITARLTKDNEQSPDGKALYGRCLAYSQITNFAAVIQKFYDAQGGGERTDIDHDDDEVCRLLAIGTPDELHDLLRDLDENSKIRFLSTPKAVSTSNYSDSSTVLQRLFTAIDCCRASVSPHASHSDAAVRLRLKLDVNDAHVLADIGDFIFKPFLVGSSSAVPAEEFRRNAQPVLGLSDRDWTRIFCMYWLHKNRSYSVHPIRLYELFRVLTRGGESGELKGELLREVRRMLIDSPRIAEALSLCVVVRAIMKNATTKKDDESNSSDWVKVEKNVEDWDMMKSTLHAVLLVDTCCRCVIFEGNPSTKMVDFQSISLRQLLLSGGGYLSEHLARSFVLVERSINGGNLNDLNDTGCCWANALRRARRMLPLSLDTERLVSGTLWEYVRAWHKKPSRIDFLSSSINLLTDLEDERLRHGFATLAWRTFFCHNYEKLCASMMHSHGKDCGEEFERETGLSSSSLLEFVRFVYVLFGVMKENVERWHENVVRKQYEIEDFLQNFFVTFRHDVSDERSGGGGGGSVRNKESLWELLTRQPTNSKYRIDLHWQLTASVLVAVATNFETRLAPLSLFSWDERSDLFKTLAIRGEHGDDEERRLPDDDAEQQQLDNRRLLFLLSYVTVAIKSSSAPSAASACQQEEESGERNLLPDLSLAVKLARAWNLNFDAVRRQEVVQLYLAGCPDLAAKLLPLVEDRRQLASTLLDIAGCALSDLWMETQTVTRPKMSPKLWNWLVARKSSAHAKGPELSLDSCNAMLAYICASVSPTSAEFKIGEELRSVIDRAK